jgi:hypothetical protein
MLRNRRKGPDFSRDFVGTNRSWSAGFEDGIGGFEDAMNGAFFDPLFAEPVLDVAAGKFFPRQSERLTADERDGFGLNLANVARSKFVAVAHYHHFIGVPQNNVGDFMEGRTVRKIRLGRDCESSLMGIPLNIAVGVCERLTIDHQMMTGLSFAPLRNYQWNVFGARGADPKTPAVPSSKRP